MAARRRRRQASITTPTTSSASPAFRAACRAPRAAAGSAASSTPSEDFKGVRLRYGRIAGPVIAEAGRHPGAAAGRRVLLPAAAGQGGWRRDVDAGHRCRARLRQARPALLHAGLAAALGGARLPDAQGQVGGAARAAARADRNRLPRQYRLDAEPLAAHPGAGAGEAAAAGVVIKQWSPANCSRRSAQRPDDRAEGPRRDTTPDFAAAWANQKKFVAQGVDWRSMSRLP